MTERHGPTFLGTTISRRALLTSTAVVAGCTSSAPNQIPSTQGELAAEREPLPPTEPVLEAYTFFTDQEARVVEAVVARLVPGNDEDPGAIQVEVPVFIDQKLSMHDDFPDAIFRQGPYGVGYAEGEEPPSGPDVVAIPAADLQQYGYQSILTPQDVYRQGIPALNQYAQQRFGASFADLDEDQQDELIAVLDDAQQRSEAAGEEQQGEGGGEQAQADDDGGETGSGGGSSDQEMDRAEELFGDVTPGSFFSTVYDDTIEGMFADPMYGGNRDMAGWRLIGYPGAQRSYSPEEMLHGTDKQPQSMHNLPVMNADRSGGGRQALEQHHHGIERG